MAARPHARSDPGGEGLPRDDRIRRGNEIRGLLGRGKRTRTSHLDVFHATSPVSRVRWGTIVPKHRRRIVDRNRLKRRLREIGRRLVLPRLRAADRTVDVVVRARPEAYDATFETLREELLAVTEAICSSESSSA